MVSQWMHANLFRLDSYLALTKIGQPHVHLVHYLFYTPVTIVGGAGTFTAGLMGLIRHSSGAFLPCIVKLRQGYSVLSTSAYCDITHAIVATTSASSRDATSASVPQCHLIPSGIMYSLLPSSDHAVNYMDTAPFNVSLGSIGDASAALRAMAARFAPIHVHIQSVLDKSNLQRNPSHHHSYHRLQQLVRACTRCADAAMPHMIDHLRDAFTSSSIANAPTVTLESVCAHSAHAWLPVSFSVRPLSTVSAHGGAWTIEAIYKGKSHGRGFVITLLDASGMPQEVVNCPLSAVQKTAQCQHAVMLAPSDAFAIMSERCWDTRGDVAFKTLGPSLAPQLWTVRQQALSLLRALGKDKRGHCLLLHDSRRSCTISLSKSVSTYVVTRTTYSSAPVNSSSSVTL